MRYQVPVTVTLRAYGPDEAKASVQRLVNEAPTAHHVRTDGFRFAIGDAAPVEITRTDQTLSLSEDERALVDRTLAEYRDE